jgi:hypothetical protein
MKYSIQKQNKTTGTLLIEWKKNLNKFGPKNLKDHQLARHLYYKTIKNICFTEDQFDIALKAAGEEGYGFETENGEETIFEKFVR